MSSSQLKFIIFQRGRARYTTNQYSMLKPWGLAPGLGDSHGHRIIPPRGRIFVAHVGDSRAVLGFHPPGGQWMVRELTRRGEPQLGNG